MKNLKKKSTRFLTMGAAGTAFFLSGCASVVNGKQEKIFIYSKPEGAKCRMYQGGRFQQDFTTPQTIKIERSRELDLILNCAKTGYELSALAWEPDMTGNYAGNESWWLASLASLSVFIPGSGLFAGGAAYDLDHDRAYGYPKDIAVHFKPLKKGSAEQILPEHFQKPSS